jgi:hypothetical protein
LSILQYSIAIAWCVEDVKEVASDLTDKECRQVLQLAKTYHDATVGINWDVLEELAVIVRDERNEK